MIKISNNKNGGNHIHVSMSFDTSIILSEHEITFIN